MINQMTFSEEKKVKDITDRLRGIASPVLRLQAILQYSQIVDILSLGDTSHERMSALLEENDKLQKSLNTSSLEIP